MIKTAVSVETVEEAAAPQLYLISALAEDGGAALKILDHQLKTAGATIVKTEDLGPKPLTFPINKKHQLNLVSVFFNLEPHKVKELDSEIAHESQINRFLLTTWREDPDKKMSARSRKPRENKDV